MVQAKRLKLKNAPSGEVEPQLGKSNSTFEFEQVELPELKDGQVLFKTVFLSNDPAQRVWISKGQDPRRAYIAPVVEGEVMRAGCVGRIVKTKGDAGSLKEGDWVRAMPGWADYAIFNKGEVQSLSPPPQGAKYSVYVGTLGLTGLTAFFGLEQVLKLKEGESIVVSGAAGATGHVVVQLAKHVFKASRVIAIAGTDEKCEWLRSLGADTAINYKNANFYDELDKATDDFPECCFDSVGGKFLSHMMTRLKRFGRIAGCGGIASYQSEEPEAITQWFEMTTNRLTWQGYIVTDYMNDAPRALKALQNAIAEGKLKLDKETIERSEIKDIPQTWLKLFSGGNTGKLVTQIADDESIPKL